MPARALKDALADAGDGGLLQTLIARRDRVGLALRAAAGPWLLRKVLPEARAIWDAARAGRWEEAETLRRAAAARWNSGSTRCSGSSTATRRTRKRPAAPNGSRRS